MRGGVVLFRGVGAAARCYLESDRSGADEYYLEGGVAVAEFSVVDGSGQVVAEGALTPGEYASWVDWTNPFTGESMGTPRRAGDGRHGSPRFAEMVINVPKSLSIAAAVHPEVSEALDAAQRDAAGEIRAWLGRHSVTRVGRRRRQQVVGVDQLETVFVSHKTSRAGDPHRHIHFQVGTRVWAAGAWRGLDTAALFKQQGAIRALGTGILAAHPQLAAVLNAHGLTLDPISGEVIELQRFNQALSKRAAQVERNLAEFEAEWETQHPGAEPGPAVRARLQATAWDHGRPNKKPARLGSEAGWRRELAEAGYSPWRIVPARIPTPLSLGELRVQEVAARALDRCAAAASAWTVHDIQEHVARLVTEAGVRAAPRELRGFVELTTGRAAEECLSVLPPEAARPEHVAHLTTLHVLAVETELRDLLHSRATRNAARVRAPVVRAAGLDADQVRAARAIASTLPLLVIEGAAGAGKTTMLAAAIRASNTQHRPVRVVAPSKKAADLAHQELGIPADSVAALVHANGWRWNADGVWTRLKRGDVDLETGAVYQGPPDTARLRPGERIVVDEAGMLDQDTTLALLTLAQESLATVALVGDRAQLPAVGRGGVLDMAAQITGRTLDLTGIHRFTDPDYARLTLELRTGSDPARLFDRLNTLGLIRLHDSEEDLRKAISRDARPGAAITTAINDEARELNARIREVRVERGEVDDTRTVTGVDGLSIGAGDVIQTRRNDSRLRVANRQTWTVQHVNRDGSLHVSEAGSARKHPLTITLPPDYVTAHTHLAYAATAYGVQGTTAPESHTMLSEAMTAAGIYVGLTRGRKSNVLHVVASDLDDAREQFTAALERDRADRGLQAATEAARAAVSGLNAGPAQQAERIRKVLSDPLRRHPATDLARRTTTLWPIARALTERRAHLNGSGLTRLQSPTTHRDFGASM